ncbi:MAG: hypothetical protein M3P15_12350, partial [Actinomycetota bacterium]|nr:hypothetical protein [Actinomycetota bacterium]
MRALPKQATVFATYSTDESFPAWADTCGAAVRPVRVDLTAKRLVEVCDEAFDWSVLLAARVVLSASREKPVDELVAVAGPAINAAAGLRARQIVHVSSGSVYET